MTDYPLVRFVSSPDTSATVRYDFNPSSSTYVGAEDFDEGVPTIEGDPGTIGAEPSYRTISFSHHLRGTTSDMATAQANLARELLRLENWLLFQRSATSEPRWIKTYRRTPGKFDHSGEFKTGISQWSFEISLDADPYWLGPRETLPTFTINNDPAVPTSPIATPTLNSPTSSTTAGTLPAATYYYKITATTSAGETTASNERFITTTGSTSAVGLTWAAVTGAAGYRVYRSTSSGTEKLLDILGNVTSYTDTGSKTPGTQAPSTSNLTAGNPMSYSLPAIKGDAETPLLMRLTGPSVGTYPNRYLFSVCATTQTAPIVPSLTINDTASVTTATGKTGYVKGDYLSVACGTTNDLTTVRFYILPTVPALGTYRLLLRIARSDTSSTFDIKASNGTTAHYTRSATPSAEHKTWAEMGDFKFPFGALMDTPPSGQTQVSPQEIDFYVQRTSGSGNLYVDAAILIPVSLFSGGDASTLTLEPSSQVQSNSYFYIDGDGEQFYVTDSSDAYFQPGNITSVGGTFPAATPGVSNLLHVFQQTQVADPTVGAGLDNPDDLRTAQPITISYAPRYLYLANS